jgi:CelD/BcsL family acetyltransferase involved in cellulose biosynthesis
LIVIEYHDDLNEVQADPVLAELLSAPQAVAPFDRIEWWRNLAQTCNFLPQIAVAREGESRAVLPLMRNGRQLYWLANWYSFRVLPLFANIDVRQDDALRLLRAIARRLAREARHLILSPLPDEHREASTLASALRNEGWIVFMAQCDVNHILLVKGRTYAEYLAARPGPLRTTLKRKARKVTVSIEHRFNSDSWSQFEAIYARSWKPHEGTPAFLRRFAEEEGAAGRLRLGIARADGVPVAAQFWTVEHNTAFIHKLAHTQDSTPLSPGTTLSAALFEHVIDQDQVSLIDFGTGDDGYKRDWMEEVRPRYRIEAFRPGRPGNWPALVKLTMRRLVGGGLNG